MQREGQESIKVLPTEGVLKKYSGKGLAGFSDGELDSAMFNKPKSFVVDLKGNLYVADKSNNAIRKISKSGVTTIAGGYSQKPGHSDGPTRNASFSDDFELNFIPGSCSLIISDHGNKLIRQINLKAEDCLKDSPSVKPEHLLGVHLRNSAKPSGLASCGRGESSGWKGEDTQKHCANPGMQMGCRNASQAGTIGWQTAAGNAEARNTSHK